MFPITLLVHVSPLLQNGATLMSRAVTGGSMEAITWLRQEYNMDIRSCNVRHSCGTCTFPMTTHVTFVWLEDGLGCMQASYTRVYTAWLQTPYIT